MLIDEYFIYLLAGIAVGFIFYQIISNAMKLICHETVRNRIEKIKQSRAKAIPRNKKHFFLDERKYQIVIFATGIVFGTLAIGSGFIFLACIIGIIVGIGISYGMSYFEEKNKKARRMKEVILLYEMIDLLTTKCGYTIYSALQMSESLLPELFEAVKKCLDWWPSGANRALEVLGQEINIPEAQVLITILQSAQDSGTERLSGVLSEEALRVDDLRRKAIEISLENKPMYQSIYVNLPFLELLGMFLGPIVYNVLLMMNGTKSPLLFH